MQKLLTQDCVTAVFGGWTSASRKAMLPVLEVNNGLLCYPVQCEGLEASKNIYNTGATTDQQIKAASTAHDGPILALGEDRAPAFDTVEAKNIDSYVEIGEFGALVTGRTFDQVVADPAFSIMVAAASEEEGPWVSALPDALRDALADAPEDRLVAAATQWAMSESNQVYSEPDETACVLQAFALDLAALSARARKRGHHLYCWTCL